MKSNHIPVFIIIVTGVEFYLKIKKQLDAMDIPSMHISELHFHYYNKGTDFKWLRDNMNKIESAYSIFEDEQSCLVFKNMLSGLIYPAGLPFINLYTEGEYFNTGIWKCGNDDTFCDCGCFDGDTLMDFINCTHGKFNKAYCFELDNKNFITLKKNVSSLNQELQNKINIYNLGVYKENTKATCGYEGESDGCEIISSGNGKPCELVRLDDIIEDCTILKMDIEGAEIDALDGAKKLIQHSKPKLALCVYHRPEDIYEIPLKVKEFCPEYKIYLRHHSYNFLDTVMYAFA